MYGLGQIIGQLLGNGYNVTERTAVEHCASAAMAQASAEYGQRPYGNAYGYNQQGYGYQQGYNKQRSYNPAMAMRVTAITNVERRQNGLRVSGLLDSRGGYRPYGQVLRLSEPGLCGDRRPQFPLQRRLSRCRHEREGPPHGRLSGLRPLI